MNKYEVRLLATPVHGFKFLVSELTSIDGGRTFYHTGNGRYFKTHKEAEAWARIQEEQNR